MGKHFPVREFWTHWKSQWNLPKILEKRENRPKIVKFLMGFLWCLKIEVYFINIFLCLLNSLNKTLKNTGKWKKYWKSRGNLSVRTSGKRVLAFIDCRVLWTLQVMQYWNDGMRLAFCSILRFSEFLYILFYGLFFLQTVVIQAPAHPPTYMWLACLVFWFCNPLAGFIAFIISRKSF